MTKTNTDINSLILSTPIMIATIIARSKDVKPCGKIYEEHKLVLELLEQKPKIGHWIGQREHCENLGVIPSGLGVYEWCSNCGCGIDVREWQRNHYNYCPSCGADMREAEESEDSE